MYYKQTRYYQQIDENLTYIACENYLHAVAFDIDLENVKIDGQLISKVSTQNKENNCIKMAHEQILQYLNKSRTSFNLPIHFTGTEFQNKIWQILQTIPFGQTKSYKEIAMAVDSPKAVRAVGASIGKNPLPIIIPCHRVIASNGKLQGFAGGLPLKQKLLNIEKVN